LLFRLTLFAIIATLEAAILDKNNLKEVKRSMFIVLNILLCNKLNSDITDDNVSLNEALQILRSDSFPYLIENLSQDKLRCYKVIELCHYCMDILSAIMTYIDRRNASIVITENQKHTVQEASDMMLIC